MNACINQVSNGYRMVACGASGGHSLIFCKACEAKYKRYYPQGWRYYPGDVCKHGRYTGGSGRDLMCGACEMGE